MWRSGQNYKLLLSVESGLQEEGSRYKSFCRDHKFKQLYAFTFSQLKPSNIFGCIWHFVPKCFNFLCQDLPGVKICQQVIEFRWNFETFEKCAANSAKMKYLETPKYDITFETAWNSVKTNTEYIEKTNIDSRTCSIISTAGAHWIRFSGESTIHIQLLSRGPVLYTVYIWVYTWMYFSNEMGKSTLQN